MTTVPCPCCGSQDVSGCCYFCKGIGSMEADRAQMLLDAKWEGVKSAMKHFEEMQKPRFVVNDYDGPHYHEICDSTRPHGNGHGWAVVRAQPALAALVCRLLNDHREEAAEATKKDNP